MICPLLTFLPSFSPPAPQDVELYWRRSLLEKEQLFFAYDVFGIPFVDPVRGGSFGLTPVLFCPFFKERQMRGKCKVWGLGL